MKGKLIAFNAKGKSGKQEITIALDKDEKKVLVGSDVDIKVKKVIKNEYME